jgi:hypothetical protein
MSYRAVLGIWGGFIHPILVALIPAWLTQIEHKAKAWRLLWTLPHHRASTVMAKFITSALLLAGTLAWLGLLFILERSLVGWLYPASQLTFEPYRMARLMGWMWLGSLPLLVFYGWISTRVSALAIPLVFSLSGLLLVVALTGQELEHPWKRDLIPWVLPYAAAERVVHTGPQQQAGHIAGHPFQDEPNVFRLPSGRKIRTWQNIPDEVLFPPPPPTSGRLMGGFSLLLTAVLLLLAATDQTRANR